MISVDTPDFDQALAASRDGSFHRVVQARLEQAMVDLQIQLRRGLSPADFERARRLESAIEKAGDVVRYALSSQPR